MIYFLLAIVAALIAYGVYAFNKLTSLRNLVAEGWSGIDVQLKRRAELIPNLVEVVKGYAAHESNLFREIVELRNKAMAGGAIADQATTGKQVFGYATRFDSARRIELIDVRFSGPGAPADTISISPACLLT